MLVGGYDNESSVSFFFFAFYQFIRGSSFFDTLTLSTAACSFFHTFREDHEHSRDLKKLESILSPLHLEVSDSAFPHCTTLF